VDRHTDTYIDKYEEFVNIGKWSKLVFISFTIHNPQTPAQKHRKDEGKEVRVSARERDGDAEEMLTQKLK